MSKWISIFLDGEEIEEKSCLLFDFGIAGITLEADGTACCYYQSEDGKVSEQLSTQIKALGLTISKVENIEEQNWTHSCDALFEPVEVGSLKIIPLKSVEDCQTLTLNKQKDLLIIPGTGFGTGHHATTFNLLKLLQKDELRELDPKSVLDAGTGSGILAIGACRSFDCKVDAYENDSLAVENARENVTLNQLDDKIAVFCESVEHAQAQYDLVIANLYAELLESLCEHLVSRGKDRSYFLLSGIRADLVTSVIEKYQSQGLKCIEKVISEGWAALILKR